MVFDQIMALTKECPEYESISYLIYNGMSGDSLVSKRKCSYFLYRDCSDFGKCGWIITGKKRNS